MCNEPLLAELLADPLTQLVMRRDGVTTAELDSVVRQARLVLNLPCRQESDNRDSPRARRHGNLRHRER